MKMPFISGVSFTNTSEPPHMGVVLAYIPEKVKNYDDKIKIHSNFGWCLVNGKNKKMKSFDNEM